MKSSALDELNKNASSLVNNIKKSYKRGFSKDLAIKHANNLIDYLNLYIVNSKQCDRQLIESEWAQNIVPVARLTFERLAVSLDIPEQFPNLPIQKLGASLDHSNLSVLDDFDDLTDEELDSNNDSFSVRHLLDDKAPSTASGQANPNPLLPAKLNPKPPTPNLPPPIPPPPTPLPSKPLPLQKRVNMQVSEVIRTTSSILPTSFSGKPDELRSFLDALSLLQSIMSSESVANKTIAVNLIKTRLTGKARDAIRTESSIEAIAIALSNNIKVPTSAEITTKLNGLKQSGTALDYVKQVEEMAEKLKRAYLDEGVSSQQSEVYVSRATAQALIKNARSERVKTVLEAGNFASATDATAKFISVVSETSSAQTLNFSRGRQGNRYRDNNRYNNNNYNRNRRSNHNNNNQNNRNNNNNNGGRNYNRRNNGNHNYNNNNNNRNRSIHTVQDQGNVSPSRDQTVAGDF